jgi:hypothetical protein
MDKLTMAPFAGALLDITSGLELANQFTPCHIQIINPTVGIVKPNAGI